MQSLQTLSKNRGLRRNFYLLATVAARESRAGVVSGSCERELRAGVAGGSCGREAREGVVGWSCGLESHAGVAGWNLSRDKLTDGRHPPC